MRLLSARTAQFAFCLAALAVVLAATSADACKTPVYRYAIYKWQRTPYTVFYLHHGKKVEADAKVNARIEKMGSAKEGVTSNIELWPVNLADAKSLDALPLKIRKMLEKHKANKQPTHVVVAPHGGQVFAGKITDKMLDVMIDSPARQQLLQMIGQGNPCVMVMVECKDAAKNKKARASLDKIIQNAAAGKYDPPDEDEAFGEAELGQPKAPSEKEKEKAAKDQPKTKKKKGLKIGLVTVARDDAKEQWFLKCLLAVDSELADFKGEPMVYTTYGRGRALDPCIGKGINEDNLGGDIAFSMGPCSCQFKDDNPGFDLLTTWDWKKTSVKLAETFGTETGNEALLNEDEFFSLILSPEAKDEKPKKGSKKPQDKKPQDTAKPKVKSLESTDPKSAPRKPKLPRDADPNDVRKDDVRKDDVPKDKASKLQSAAPGNVQSQIETLTSTRTEFRVSRAGSDEDGGSQTIEVDAARQSDPVAAKFDAARSAKAAQPKHLAPRPAKKGEARARVAHDRTASPEYASVASGPPSPPSREAEALGCGQVVKNLFIGIAVSISVWVVAMVMFVRPRA